MAPDEDTEHIAGQEPVVAEFRRKIGAAEVVVFHSLPVGHIVVEVVHKAIAHTRFGMEVEATLAVELGSLA